MWTDEEKWLMQALRAEKAEERRKEENRVRQTAPKTRPLKLMHVIGKRVVVQAHVCGFGTKWHYSGNGTKVETITLNHIQPVYALGRTPAGQSGKKTSFGRAKWNVDLNVGDWLHVRAHIGADCAPSRPALVKVLESDEAQALDDEAAASKAE